MSCIVLGISGSIAAYKAADIASQLVKLGHEVHCICTRSALEFVSPLTLQTLSRQRVLVDLADEKGSWSPGHIGLAQRADVFVVAPATANTIGNFANGLAPDTLSCIFLATQAPTIVCPAMNTKMWEHPATQANISRLQSWGVRIFGPAAHGILACGDVGKGRLMPPEDIVAEILRTLKQ